MEYIFIADCKFVLSFVLFFLFFLSKWLMPFYTTFFFMYKSQQSMFFFLLLFCFVCMSANISTVLSAVCVFVCVHSACNISVFVLRSTWQGSDRSACRTSMSASRSKLDSEERRYITPPLHRVPIMKVVFSFCCHFCLLGVDVASCVFQYDSDGSDSQESSEEAELRRKKIEALKVSLEEAKKQLHFPISDVYLITLFAETLTMIKLTARGR